MARIAGLLAIAVFGIVMVMAFSVRLDHELASVNIPPAVRNQLLSNRTRLAAVEVPQELDSQQAAQVKTIVADSFIYAFRLIAWCCAALALASAVTAVLTIEGEPVNRQKA